MMACRNWFGDQACCPDCQQAIRPCHLRKSMVHNRELKYAHCPNCGKWLRCLFINAADSCFTSSVIKQIALTFFAIAFCVIHIAISIGIMDYCAYSRHELVIKLIALVMLSFPVIQLFFWIKIYRNWRFKFRHKVEVWFPRCEKCGYDMRHSKGDCPECGSRVEPHPSTRQTYGSFGW